MPNQTISTRLAVESDIDRIISISTLVQDALTASGSLQVIGPLNRFTVSSAVEEEHCFVAIDGTNELVGCVMVRVIDENFFPSSSNFSVADYPKPWSYLHSMMLVPEAQGQGSGLKVFEDVMEMLAPGGGTALLDCWAGNDKLRSFYARAACQYVATLPEEDYEIAVFVRILNNGK
jgi:GNAT superfamily N-acetyltransferase